MDMEEFRALELMTLGSFRKMHPVILGDDGYTHPMLPGQIFPKSYQGRSDAEFRAHWAFRDDLKRQAVASCANWLHPGQAVEVISDKRMDGRNWQGRKGSIHHLCTSGFPDYCYVFFPKRGRERSDKIEMMHILAIGPVNAERQAA